MRQIIIGLALNGITLSFWALDILLPLLGQLLLLLGFRSLRRENRWFGACYWLSVWRFATSFSLAILYSTIFSSRLLSYPLLHGLCLFQVTALPLLLCFCLWRALCRLKRKAALAGGAGAALALLIWQAVLLLLAACWQQSWLLLGLLLLASYLLFLRQLLRLFKTVGVAGYAVQASPVRLSDRWLAVTLLLLLLLGSGCGYLWGGRYHQDWQLAPSPGAATESLSSRLEELGFPGQLLSDLSEEDLLACSQARRIVVQEQAFSAQGMFLEADSAEEPYLLLSYVAVEIAGSRESWQIFHFFRWLQPPEFRGTEAIEIWPGYRLAEGWAAADEPNGYLFYDDEQGRCYRSDYALLSVIATQAQQDTLFADYLGSQDSPSIYAAFSLPQEGKALRGYIRYGLQEQRDGCIIDSWSNYVHQDSPWQYPVYSALDEQRHGGWLSRRPFTTYQDALQFFPTEDEIQQW